MTNPSSIQYLFPDDRTTNLGRFRQGYRDCIAYSLDYSNWLQPGETVLYVTFSIYPATPAALAAVDASAVGALVNFKLQGGQSGAFYRVRVTVITSADQVKTDTILVDVDEVLEGLCDEGVCQSDAGIIDRLLLAVTAAENANAEIQTFLAEVDDILNQTTQANTNSQAALTAANAANATSALALAAANDALAHIPVVDNGTGIEVAFAASISGPTPPDTYTVSVDVPWFDARYALVSQVPHPNLVILPATIVQPHQFNPYNHSLTGAGGLSPYTFVVTSGVFPVGMTLHSDGSITGAPVTMGTYEFEVTMTDAYGFQKVRAISMTVGAQIIITISPSALPDGTVGEAYSETLVASDGAVTPYTYAVTSGALPAGLSLNATSGVLSGTPTAHGAFAFIVSATDAEGNVGTHAYGLTIAHAIITLEMLPATLPAGVVGTAYSETIAASGGTSPYTYAITAGTLPSGLSINSTTGIISGTPTASGSDTFSITATDADGNTGTIEYTVEVTASGSTSMALVAALCDLAEVLTPLHGYVAASVPSTGAGGASTAGGSLTPNTLSGQICAVAAQAEGTAMGIGDVYVAFQNSALVSTFFTSVVIPGLNGGAPLTSASATFSSGPAGDGLKLWKWTDVSGTIASGTVVFA